MAAAAAGGRTLCHAPLQGQLSCVRCVRTVLADLFRVLVVVLAVSMQRQGALTYAFDFLVKVLVLLVDVGDLVVGVVRTTAAAPANVLLSDGLVWPSERRTYLSLIHI